MYKFLYATKKRSRETTRRKKKKNEQKKEEKKNLNYPERIHKYESLPRPIDSNLCLSSLQNSNQNNKLKVS